MNVAPAPTEANVCPLCGQLNDCQLCTTTVYKGPCWCARVEIPEALLAQVPADARNQSCLCRACVMEYHRAKEQAHLPRKVLPEDFYFDHGLLVFTAAHHLRRGYCCGNGCRHCPY